MVTDRTQPANTRRLESLLDIKALAHPVRMRLIYALKTTGPMTATQLGEIVGDSPAAMSYHLRQLAEHGFVEEAEGVGADRRQRWWKAVDGGFTWDAPSIDAREDREVHDAAHNALIAHHWNRLGEYARSTDWSQEWQQAAFSSDDLLRLTPEDMSSLHTELREVVDRWRGRSESTDGDQHVMVLLHGFPIRP